MMLLFPIALQHCDDIYTQAVTLARRHQRTERTLRTRASNVFQYSFMKAMPGFICLQVLSGCPAAKSRGVSILFPQLLVSQENNTFYLARNSCASLVPPQLAVRLSNHENV